MTIAAFKRAITPGTTVHLENHVLPRLSRDTVVRRVQSRRFTTDVVHKGETVESTITFPAARLFEFDGTTARFFEMWPDGSKRRSFTVTIVGA